jgi:AraC-like DNA-binding protein/quercetin dioxygenase-like cupin family protein
MSRNGHADAAVLVGTFPLGSGHRIDRHRHRMHQLAWAADGVLTVDTDAGIWVLPRTRALWIPTRVWHGVEASGRATMKAAYLNPAACPIDWTEPRAVAVGGLLAELIDYLGDPSLDPPRRARAEAVLFDALVPVDVETLDAPLPTDPRARTVAQAIIDDPADVRDLRRWAREVGVSDRTLARAFVAGTGIPFGRWRTLTRLGAALPALAAGEPVGRVARAVGYQTPSAFVAAFRRETGLTPGAYFGS